ncbi:hypothetical protein B6A27_03315 [Anoxybacillus sp. UARK-01]|nr:hypothetical protein B6A27_03315 [Anoxybacillus sp. UARK-01]
MSMGFYWIINTSDSIYLIDRKEVERILQSVIFIFLLLMKFLAMGLYMGSIFPKTGLFFTS